MAHDFKTHNLVFSTPWHSIFERDNWYALHSPTCISGGGALIMDADQNILLVEIYRHPLDEVLLEIPRGGFDPEKDSTGLSAAIREAQEEAGIDLADAEVIDLGTFFPDSGILAFELSICAAILPHSFANPEPDLNEVVGYRIMPFAELLNRAANGDIKDASTIVAAFRLQRILKESASTQLIEILDQDGEVVRTIETERPDWSFNQFIRNRDASGWTWRAI